MYVLTLRQVVVHAIITAITIASALVAYLELVTYRALPEVNVDATGACVRVINHANGDAFQCQDVNVVLRKFRVKVIENEKER